MDRPLTQNIVPGREPLDLKGYEAAGGYAAMRKALGMSPQAIQEELLKSTVLGRGGAGFEAGKKWRHMPTGPDARRPKYLVVNADEMEPATMKDRLLMEGDPHQLVEAVIISSFAVGVDVAYIFIRKEYVLAANRLEKAIAEAYAAGYLGGNVCGAGYALELHLHRSAGRYMCGEAAAMLSAIEGRRAVPRSRPPHMAQVGLWGKPTLVDNVETLCCVPHIVLHGSDWFLKLSRTAEGGTKIFGVSGRVKRPGMWELPMGTTAREIIFEHAGGMLDGYRLRGFIPGGASSGFLTDAHLDVKLDFANVRAAGSHFGTGTMVVLDDRTCPVGVVLSLEMFFARESCGWCTPCREGLPWVARTLQALEDGKGKPGDIEVLDDHVRLLRDDHTFCDLAVGAMLPLGGALAHFREDFERHVKEKRCPYSS